MVVIESCLVNECAFMRAYLTEIHFMYMYYTLFSNLHLTIHFDKFGIYVFENLMSPLPSCI